MNNYVRLYSPAANTEFQLVRRSEVPADSTFIGEPKFGYFLPPKPKKVYNGQLVASPGPFIPKPSIRNSRHRSWFAITEGWYQHRKAAKQHAHRVTRRKVRQALHNGEEEVYFQLGYTSWEFC